MSVATMLNINAFWRGCAGGFFFLFMLSLQSALHLKIPMAREHDISLGSYSKQLFTKTLLGAVLIFFLHFLGLGYEKLKFGY